MKQRLFVFEHISRNGIKNILMIVETTLITVILEVV